MTSKDKPNEQNNGTQVLEEICDNTRAIRRVTNRILDHLHEYPPDASSYENSLYSDPDELSWDDLNNNDDMYTWFQKLSIVIQPYFYIYTNKKC